MTEDSEQSSSQMRRPITNLTESDQNENDDSPRVSQTLEKHRSKLQQFAQRFNVQLKYEEQSNQSSTFKEDSNYQGTGANGSGIPGDSFKVITQLSETQKQMEGIDDFDTSKFKQKLYAISQNFNRFNNQQQQQPSQMNTQTFNYNQEPQKKFPTTQFQSKFDEVKRKYSKERQITESDQQSDQSDLDWRQYLDKMRKNADQPKNKIDKHFNKSSKSKKQQADDNIKQILQKYGKDGNLFQDITVPSENSSSQADEFNQLSFRSDLEPSISQSPRLPQKGSPVDDEDGDIRKIKNKYFNKNSPEQKKDDTLRKSSEQLFNESISQNDHLRKSQDLINNSLEDLLSTLKNRFQPIKGQQHYNHQQQYQQQKRHEASMANSIKEEVHFEDESFQEPSQQIQRNSQVRQSSNINDILKQSPKVLLKAKQDQHSVHTNSSGKKLRKSQENINEKINSFPRSSENKNILFDQFVPLNFNQNQINSQSQQPVQNQPSNQSNKVQMAPLNLKPIEQLKDQEIESIIIQRKDTDNQREQDNIVFEEDFEKVQMMLNQPSFSQFDNISEYSQNNNYFKDQITESAGQITDRDQKEVNFIVKPPSNNVNNDNKQTPKKSLSTMTKLTPLKSGSKLNSQKKSQLPKYNDIMKVTDNDIDEGQIDDELYQKDLAEIQDTLKTIKEMNLLGSPVKELNEYIKEETNKQQNVSSGGKGDHSLNEQQEIDYNLSDSDEENGMIHQTQLQKSDLKQQNLIKKAINQRGDFLNEDEISFCSSSEQNSVYDNNHLRSSQKQNQYGDISHYQNSPQSLMVVKKDQLEFRDQELYHLMNFVPLAEQKLQSLHSCQKREDIQSSLLKINYFVERLKYLNGIM